MDVRRPDGITASIMVVILAIPAILKLELNVMIRVQLSLIVDVRDILLRRWIVRGMHFAARKVFLAPKSLSLPYEMKSILIH